MCGPLLDHESSVHSSAAVWNTWLLRFALRLLQHLQVWYALIRVTAKLPYTSEIRTSLLSFWYAWPMKLMHYAYVENHWSADAKETVLNELLGWQSIQSLGKKKRLIRLISRDHVQSCYIHFILPSHFTLIKVRGMKTVLSAVYLMAHKNMRKVELFIAKFLKLQYSGVFRCTHWLFRCLG